MTPVEQIKNNLDIVDVISGYIALKQIGGNFKANCPFHNEKTPSFMVSREKQIWHCFGCDKGGDVIKFVQEYEGVDFVGALKILAPRANVTLDNIRFETREDYSRLYELNNLAVEFYQQKLRTNSEVSQKVLNYLHDRQVSDDSIKKWQLGLSSESWDELYLYLKNKNYKDDEIFQAGLSIKKKDGSGYLDRFRKRLMFPILDYMGRPVAFTSRTLQNIAYADEDIGGKYVNSPQTVIYDKSKILYGWSLAKEAIRRLQYLIVVEGNLDVIMAHQAGTQNAVAVSGTALTIDHLKNIKRYTQNLILAFDGDSAGSRAAFKSIALAWGEDMTVKILVLPKDADPADIVKADPKSWLETVKKSVVAMDYYFQRIIAGVDPTRADHKKIAVQKLLPIIKYLKTQIEQVHYLQLLSQKLQIPMEILQSDFGKTTAFLEQKQAVAIKSAEQKKDRASLLSEKLLALAFYKKDYLEQLIAEIDLEMIAGDWQSLYKKVIVYYTKHQHLDNFLDSQLDSQDKNEWIRLVMWGEATAADLKSSDLTRDFLVLLKAIKKSYLDNNKQKLIDQLRQAEIVGDQATEDHILHKIHLLDKEIQQLKN